MRAGVVAITVVLAAVAQTPDAAKPTHAIRGVVKAISLSSLVITTGSGMRMHEMTFWLTPSTLREGEPSVGATVSVRYRKEHDLLTATAVSVS